MGPAFSRKYATLLVTGTTAIRIPLIKRGLVDFAVGADFTPATGDVKINIDGAGPANVTNLPTAVASGNGAYWEFILTAAELSCKQAIVTVVDAATKAVEDQCFLVETFGNASAMYAADLSLANLPANVVQFGGAAATTASGRPEVNASHWAGIATTLSSGVPDVNMKTITAGIIAAASFAANALDAVWSTATRVLTAATNLTTALATPTNITAGTITSVSGAVGSVASGGITAASIAADAITAAKIADGAIDAATFAAGAINAAAIAADAITDAKVASDVTIASVTGAVGSVTGAVGSVTGLTASNLDATISSRLATSGYTAPPTAAQNAAGVLDLADGVEVGLTLRQAQRLIAAALAGKLSGAATTTITIRNAVADSKDRIVATVDSDGDRSAITVDLT